jgi:hypothetical protein
MKKLLLVASLCSFVVLAFAIRVHAVSRQVRVAGRAQPKIELSLDTTSVNFGAIDPAVPTEAAPAFTATVKSNKVYAYALSAPASFSGGARPDISHLEWDRWGAPPPGYLPCWEGDVDTVLFAPKTAARDFRYSLRLTWGFDEEPDIDYSAELTVTAVQW